MDIHGQKTTHDENYELYEVKTEEPDKDAVFYTMATEPITDLIEIEYGEGIWIFYTMATEPITDLIEIEYGEGIWMFCIMATSLTW